MQIEDLRFFIIGAQAKITHVFGGTWILHIKLYRVLSCTGTLKVYERETLYELFIITNILKTLF